MSEGKSYRCDRNLVAANYNGSMKRGVGRPRMKPRCGLNWSDQLFAHYAVIVGAAFALRHQID